MADSTRLRRSAIRVDGGTQSRDSNRYGVIEEYAEAMREGAVFPPVLVVFDGTDYWLADGFHRVLAAEMASVDALDAEVRQGTRRDAVWLSCGANIKHGLRRSTADKQRAIETLLRDPEWVKMSDREISRHVGVDDKTVGAHRARLEGTAEIPQSTQRQGADGRTINTANIGSQPRTVEYQITRNAVTYTAPRYVPDPVRQGEQPTTPTEANTERPGVMSVAERLHLVATGAATWQQLARGSTAGGKSVRAMPADHWYAGGRLRRDVEAAVELLKHQPVAAAESVPLAEALAVSDQIQHLQEWLATFRATLDARMQQTGS